MAGLIIGLVFFIVGIVVGIEMAINPEAGETPQSGIYIAVFCVVMVVVFAVLLVKEIRKPKKPKTEKTRVQRGYFTEYICKAKLTHLSGLPFPEGTQCLAFLYEDKIQFILGTTEISLARNKITDIRLMTASEIQKQAVSSAGGAVAGAMLLGPIGAVIGGRAKAKQIKTKTKCLLITYYDRDGKMATIAFDADRDPNNAAMMARDFKRNNQNQGVKIEL